MTQADPTLRNRGLAAGPTRFKGPPPCDLATKNNYEIELKRNGSFLVFNN